MEIIVERPPAEPLEDRPLPADPCTAELAECICPNF
jgi:hypothetical protein